MQKKSLTLEDKALEMRRGEPYNIVVFDTAGQIVARVGTDTPFLKKNNFFALLSEEERDFFDEWSVAFGQKRLLLESTRGPMLVFSGLFRETGLFVAVLFHTPRETVRGFWKSGFWQDINVSPFLMEKTLPRKSGNEEDLFKIIECVGLLDPILSPGVTPLPMQDGDWMLSSLNRMVSTLARCFGCAVSLREGRHALLSERWAFSMPSFAATVACLLSLVANYTMAEPALIDIYEEDGRIFVRLDTSLAFWRDKVSKAHRFDYPELAACAKIAERHDLFLNVVSNYKDDGVALSVLFSPQYPNASAFGLKNPLELDV